MPESITVSSLCARSSKRRKGRLLFSGVPLQMPLRRWDVASKTMDKKAKRGIEIRKAADGTKTYSIANRQVILFPEKYRFVPIPKDEIDRSNKVLIQNDGY